MNISRPLLVYFRSFQTAATQFLLQIIVINYFQNDMENKYFLKIYVSFHCLPMVACPLSLRTVGEASVQCTELFR